MMNDRMNNRNKVVLVTGAGWPMTANGAKRSTVAEAAGSHAIDISKPEVVVALIIDAAKGVSPKLAVA